MNDIIKYLEGKKTYIVAAIVFVLGGLQAIGYPVPEYVYPLLGALGLGTLRAGVSKTTPSE
jgi:hypothetical protein